MTKYIALAAGLILGTVATTQAAQPKEPRVVACSNFDTFTDAHGVTIGVCGAKKPGGKVTYLGSYQVVSVINPATDKPAKLMVGFSQ